MDNPSGRKALANRYIAESEQSLSESGKGIFFSRWTTFVLLLVSYSAFTPALFSLSFSFPKKVRLLLISLY